MACLIAVLAISAVLALGGEIKDTFVTVTDPLSTNLASSQAQQAVN